MSSSNHPNRSATSANRNPTPAEITALLALVGLTAAEGAALVPVTERNMLKWIADKPDGRMHPSFWKILKYEIAMMRAPELREQMDLQVSRLDAILGDHRG